MPEREFIINSVTKSKNVIIDGHAHAGFDAANVMRRRYPTTQSVIDMVRKMKANDVKHTIVFPCPSDIFWFYPKGKVNEKVWTPIQDPPEAFPYEKVNSVHFYEVQLFGYDYILPFANILPSIKEDEQIDFLVPLAKQKVLFGLKFHTLAIHTHAHKLNDSKFVELAEKYSLPIMLHCGSDEYSKPQQVITLAQKYPNVRFCIAHSADFEAEIFEFLQTNSLPNVFIDTSPHISNCILAQREKSRRHLDLPYHDAMETLIQLYKAFPYGLIWGTDEPWTTVTNDTNKTIFAKVLYEDEVNLLKKLPPEIRYQIAYVNSLRFLFGDKVQL